jgi:hypothetical protein
MGDDRIRCTGIVSVNLDGKSHEVFGADLWKDPSPLTRIVGRDVVSWRVESTHTFSVTLTDNAVISFTSEDSPYEDFIIDPEILVW